MPDVEGKENLSDETQQVLSQRMWNKNVEGAWRMDINVGIVENTEENEGTCSVQSDLNDNCKGSGSESESESESEADLSGEEESDSESSTD